MEGVSVEAIQEGGRLSKEGVEWSEGSQTFASRQDLVARGGDDILEEMILEGIEKFEGKGCVSELGWEGGRRKVE